MGELREKAAWSVALSRAEAIGVQEFDALDLAAQGLTALADCMTGEDREAWRECLYPVVGHGGFADDDGVWHEGPTVADAKRADTILDSIAAELRGEP